MSKLTYLFIFKCKKKIRSFIFHLLYMDKIVLNFYLFDHSIINNYHLIGISQHFEHQCITSKSTKCLLNRVVQGGRQNSED